MLDLDGTQNKNNLGANAILSVSIATLRAASRCNKTYMYQQLSSNKKFYYANAHDECFKWRLSCR